MTGCGRSKSNKRPPPNVTTARINQMEVSIYVDSIGQAIPPVTVNIRPQVAGKLIKAYIQQGSIVKEKDILYEIDPKPYQAILEQALAQLIHDEALLQYANQAVERNRKVVEENFISKITFEQYLSTAAAAQAQVELDKAAIDYAQVNLDYTKVVAPVSGKISYFNVDVGNVLNAYDPNQITVIRPFSPIDVIFSLPQAQFEMIRREQGNAGEWPFLAILPERPDQSFAGATYFIDNQIDQNTGTILLKGRLPNVDRELWPGEFIKFKVLHKIVPDTLTVPPGAVLMGREGPYVYIVDEKDQAAAENVKVLTRTEDYIAIASDRLKAGDRVITDGQINVAPGIKVNDVSMKAQ
jgi:membrane fusion protein, multidrug efflux system